MFDKEKKYTLEMYQAKRKDKISVFGQSAIFDWFLIRLTTFILLVLVFVLSIYEIRYVRTFDPEPDTSSNSLLSDSKTSKNLESISEKFKDSIPPGDLDEDVGSDDADETIQ